MWGNVVCSTSICNDIDKRLVPVELGKLRTRDLESISPLVVEGKKRCLICGVVHIDDACHCRENCGFSCHSRCILALSKIMGKIARTNISPNNWACDDISHWISPEAVDEILECRLTRKRVDELMNLYHIERVTLHKDTRKRRYDNLDADQVCEFCMKRVPLEQHDHLWSFCDAISAPPVSNDAFESVSLIKTDVCI